LQTQGSTTYGQYRRDDAMDLELQPNIETNLAINQAYQELLDNLILRVEMGLGRVRERQVSLFCFDFHVHKRMLF
jgi:hypothetical protein